MNKTEAKQIALNQVKTRWVRVADKCCQCEQRISVTSLGHFEHVPLASGHHTSFWLMRCLECRKLVGFPHENFLLALKDGTDFTRVMLADLVYRAQPRWYTLPDRLWNRFTKWLRLRLRLHWLE